MSLFAICVPPSGVQMIVLQRSNDTHMVWIATMANFTFVVQFESDGNRTYEQFKEEPVSCDPAPIEGNTPTSFAGLGTRPKPTPVVIDLDAPSVPFWNLVDHAQSRTGSIALSSG